MRKLDHTIDCAYAKYGAPAICNCYLSAICEDYRKIMVMETEDSWRAIMAKWRSDYDALSAKYVRAMECRVVLGELINALPSEEFMRRHMGCHEEGPLLKRARKALANAEANP